MFPFLKLMTAWQVPKVCWRKSVVKFKISFDFHAKSLNFRIIFHLKYQYSICGGLSHKQSLNYSICSLATLI